MPEMPGQWKAVAVPKEHGAWVMIAEAVLVGLGLALSWEGIVLGAVAVLAFFLTHPLKIFVRDLLDNRSFPRTMLAMKVAAVYAALMIVGFAAVLMNNPYPFWMPLVFAGIFYSLQIYFAVGRNEKTLAAEIMGGLATGSVAAAITIAGGFSLPAAFAVWAALMVRGATSIVYVRHRLRKSRDEKYSLRNVTLAHAGGLLALVGLQAMYGLPIIIILSFLVLFARAVYYLEVCSSFHRPQVVGIQEIIFGLFNSVMIVLSFR
ncbi:MAG: YwiC-like family protein [Candidatus Omnitrophota bacterium]|nr:YwiC-like family protein [Candidatus Omnitrophota bacterium]MDZ4242536.1 YwiC-like family protein [Candidatus Omnitrophota bacterium]